MVVVDAAERLAGWWAMVSRLQVGAAQSRAAWLLGRYGNIFGLIESLNLDEDPLTGYAEQGQYSPRGLEAIWPVYRDSQQLPTGLGQALLTRFKNLSPLELATAAPLVLAFSEFDDSESAWERYDKISFRDLCVKLGVSERLYKEAFVRKRDSNPRPRALPLLCA